MAANNSFQGVSPFRPAVPVAPIGGTAVSPTMSGPIAAPMNPPMQQNAPMNAQPQQPQMQSNVHYVNNMEEMLNFPAGPNEHMYFPEIDGEYIWLRETDGNGNIKNPVRRMQIGKEEEIPFGPEANFVTKQQHQELYNMVAGMAQTMNGMADTINWLKEELGGKAQ